MQRDASHVYLLPPLKWVVPVLIAGENSVSNNNYEQLVELNSQIETHDIEIQTNNKSIVKYLQDNLLLF